MPIVPLYDAHIADPELPCHMRAPGGYDWWRLHAFSIDAGLEISIDFFEGCPFDPQYLAHYLAYRARPTAIAPPQAQSSVQANFKNSSSSSAAPLFQASVSAGYPTRTDEVYRVGNNALMREAGGTRRIVLHARTTTGESIEGTLRWTALTEASETLDLTGSFALGGAHWWTPVAPACDVGGTLKLDAREVEFRGRGSYTRRSGVTPLPAFLGGWNWGTAIAGDRIVSWEVLGAPDMKTKQIYIIDAGSTAGADVVTSQVSESEAAEPSSEYVLARAEGSIQYGGPPVAGSNYISRPVNGTWHGEPLLGASRSVVTQPRHAIYAPSTRLVKH